MNNHRGRGVPKPLISWGRGRLMAVRLLMAAVRIKHLSEHDILHDEERLAAIMGPRRHERLRLEIEAAQEDAADRPSLTRQASLPSRRLAMQHLVELEKVIASRVGRRQDHVEANVRRFGHILGLNATEIAIINLSVRFGLDPDLAEAAQVFNPMHPSHMVRVLAKTLHRPHEQVRTALAEESRLMQSGVLSVKNRCHDASRMDFGNISPLPGLAACLYSERFDFARVFSPFFRRCGKSKLSLSQFEYLGDAVRVLPAILAGALRHRSQGIQVLLYGPPGTGKTELVHAIAKSVGAPLYAVATGSANGMPYDRDERFNSFRLAQQALKSRGKALLLFDEVEDVFPGHFEFAEGSRRQKGWINELLETNPVPSIWISNRTSSIDDAYLRRFTLTIHVDRPPRSIRRRICADYLEEFSIEDRVLTRLADADDITPADLDRTRRAMKMALDLPSQPIAASRVATTLLASGPRGPSPSALLPNEAFRLPKFDPALINTTLALPELLDGLARSGEGRLCLYGPPGTGKTAFAAYLAERLDRELMTVSASSWLDPFLGMTERKMRESFERAARTNAVLFVDEADSFLRDRTGARQSWEVTQVNELLKRLEESRGIVLFATNAFDALDAAVLRRLDVKAAFRPLNREQARVMFERTLAANGDNKSHRERSAPLARVDAASGLVNGDFAAACRHLHVTGQAMTPDNLADALAREVHAREQQKGQSIGFAAAIE